MSAVLPSEMAQSEAQSTVEKLWRQSQKYSVNANDALVTLICKAFESSAVVLSPTSDNVRIDHAISSLHNERKLVLQFEKKGFDVLRHLSFGLIETIQVLLQEKRKNIEEQNQILVDPAEDSSLAIMEPKEEPIDAIDRIIEGNQQPIADDSLGDSLFKEEEIDFDFEVDNATLPIEQPLNEVPSNDMDSRAMMVPSDVMGEDTNSINDPIIDDRNSTPIEKEPIDSLLSSGENVDESNQAEMMEEENELIEEEKEDTTVHHTTDTPKDSSEAGEVKKKRPSRTSTRLVNYTESLDDSEPRVKKPRIKPGKQIDNKRRSDLGESSSKSPSKVVRVAKINHMELECPKCEYRSRSVGGWCVHLTKIHSTNPRDLGLALLCECGHEFFTDSHSRECDISKITIIHKNATPQCVMCEAHPKTARGYAQHLEIHHKTTLKQKRIFLTCSCGLKVTSSYVDPEHSKKCNGHEYTLHNVDDEG